MPVLPEIRSADLQPLDDETYWALMERERRITNWAFDLESVLMVVCGG